MSAAQYVLGMDELLRNILGYIPVRAVRAPYRLSEYLVPPPSFLLAAAHVNKQWRDVALDFLWNDIDCNDLEKIIVSWQNFSSQVCTYNLESL